MGLGDVNRDAETLRLEQTLVGIQPRITGTAFHWIEHPTGRVLIVGIPRSLSAPHMVWAQETGQFWGRNNAGKFLMDVTQVRQAMLGANEWERVAAEFRDSRIVRLQGGVGAHAITGDGAVLLHVLPLGGPRPRADLPSVKPSWQSKLDPGGATHGYRARPNADGWIVSAHSNRGHRHIQVFREGGGIEARFDLDGFARGRNTFGGLNIDGIALEFQLAKWTKLAMGWFRAAEIEGPFAVFVTVIQSLNVTFENTNPEMSHLAGDYHVDVPIVMLPPQRLEDIPEEIAATLRPTFDALWQSASWPSTTSTLAKGGTVYDSALSNENWD